MTIKTVIIDDDYSASLSLKVMIEEHFSDLELIGIADSVSAGVELIETTKPDLALLDISLPDGSGFDMLNALQYRNFEVIFTTSHTDYAIKAFEFSALHYLLKPITLEKLKSAVARIKSFDTFENFNDKMQVVADTLVNKPEKILLPTGGGLRVHEIKDIIRCESDANYTNVFFVNKEKILVSKNLQNLDSILSDYGFLRVHKSHLINVAYLKEFYRGKKPYIVMNDGIVIPISNTRRDEVNRILKLHYVII